MPTSDKRFTSRGNELRTPIRIGIIGTGFVMRNFVAEATRRTNYQIAKVLTRRKLKSWAGYTFDDVLTNDTDELIDASDVVFESTGHPVYAATTIGRALEAGKPVVTLNAEFHATVGSYFADHGLLTEAEGDQPGSLAALHANALQAGLRPLVYGNLKGFLNLRPSREEMKHWADKQGYSLDKVTSFTDGTKLQMEQCLVANWFGATIAAQGMTGLPAGDVSGGAIELARLAAEMGQPIVDYLIGSNLPHGVFISGTHDPQQAGALRNYKMGDGPSYVMQLPQCLGHLEVFKTIDDAVLGGKGLLNNGSQPQISVAAVAKHDLKRNDFIAQGIGSFDLRGSCVKMADHSGHLPIGLAANIRLTRAVENGQILTFDDVEVPESLALTAWRAIENRVFNERCKPVPVDIGL